jgi:hypothetical protein
MFQTFFIINRNFKNILSKCLSKLKFYFLYQFLIKKVTVKNIDEVHVFCQGESLNCYNDLILKHVISKPNIAILANFEKNNLIDSNLKKNLKNVPFIFVANITEPIPYFTNLIGIKLFEVFIGRFINKYHNGEFRRQNFRLDSISNDVKYMPNDIIHIYETLLKDNGRSNIGILSLLIACYYKPKKIKIFGLDFYESEYFDEDLLSDMTFKHKKYVKKNSPFVKKSFLKIIQNYKSINFEIYTKANLKFFENNLNVYSL